MKTKLFELKKEENRNPQKFKEFTKLRLLVENHKLVKREALKSGLFY